MKTTKLFSVLALALAGAANAATVSLVPESAFVDEGASFDINLVLDAADADGASPGSFNGIVTIEYDPTLVNYDGFNYSAPAAPNTAPMVIDGGSVERVILDFTGALNVGDIGSYSFTALAAEGIDIVFSIVPALSGGFANEDPTNRPFEPDFENASVGVVPLPASAWLMLSALGFVAVRVRRRT